MSPPVSHIHGWDLIIAPKLFENWIRGAGRLFFSASFHLWHSFLNIVLNWPTCHGCCLAQHSGLALGHGPELLSLEPWCVGRGMPLTVWWKKASQKRRCTQVGMVVSRIHHEVVSCCIKVLYLMWSILLLRFLLIAEGKDKHWSYKSDLFKLKIWVSLGPGWRCDLTTGWIVNQASKMLPAAMRVSARVCPTQAHSFKWIRHKRCGYFSFHLSSIHTFNILSIRSSTWDVLRYNINWNSRFCLGARISFNLLCAFFQFKFIDTRVF